MADVYGCFRAVVCSRVSGVVFGASIDDHKRYRDRHGNAQWRWRVIDIPARAIAELGEPSVELVGGFTREECLAFFHSE